MVPIIILLVLALSITTISCYIENEENKNKKCTAIIFLITLITVAIPCYIYTENEKYFKLVAYDSDNKEVDLSNWVINKVDINGNLVDFNKKDDYYWGLVNSWYGKILDNIIEYSVDFQTYNGETIYDTINYKYCFKAYIGEIINGKIVGGVPAYINNIPVISIEGAFLRIGELEEQPKIPETVMYSDYAFEGTGLIKVGEIPSSVKSARRMYSSCSNLTDADLNL